MSFLCFGVRSRHKQRNDDLQWIKAAIVKVLDVRRFYLFFFFFSCENCTFAKMKIALRVWE